MSLNPFHDGGALDGDSPVYLERAADGEALQRLRRMDYLVLVAPRQQGKSSLINRLAHRLGPDGFAFIVVDAGTLDRSSESVWYRSLAGMAGLFVDFAPQTAPTNANTWFRYLKELADAAQRADHHVVFALDEVGATPAGWATEFFTTIRSLYNYRATLPAFKRLTFIIAGAYNPKDLIRDPTISNFNLAHFSPIDDFSAEQVGQLARLLPLPAGDADAVARRLFHWTGGHPYLTQALGYRLFTTGHPSPAGVDAAVEAFFRDDISHFLGIKRWLDGREGLAGYLHRIVAGPTRFAPGINDHQFHLAYVAGIIAADEQGNCRIRNRMYDHMLASLLDETAAPENNAPPWSEADRRRLFDHLEQHYDMPALRDLCFELGIDIDNLPGTTLRNKQHQLISYLEQRRRYDDLRRLSTAMPRV